MSAVVDRELNHENLLEVVVEVEVEVEVGGDRGVWEGVGDEKDFCTSAGDCG